MMPGGKKHYKEQDQDEHENRRLIFAQPFLATSYSNESRRDILIAGFLAALPTIFASGLHLTFMPSGCFRATNSATPFCCIVS